MDNRKNYTPEEVAAIRETTSGFYKRDPDGGDILYGRFYVINKDWELHRHLKDTYSLPVDDWYWFDSEDQARATLGVPRPPEPEQDGQLV